MLIKIVKMYTISVPKRKPLNKLANSQNLSRVFFGTKDFQ